MCKFHKLYICAVVGVIIERLDNMYGVTTEIDNIIVAKVHVSVDFNIYTIVCSLAIQTIKFIRLVVL